MTTVLSMTLQNLPTLQSSMDTYQTSSPRFPQSNSFVERMVKTVKKLLQQSDHPCLALLTFRSTSLPWCNLSPAELLMGRRLRTQLPQTPQHLKPTWSYLTQFRKKDKRFKETQKRNFDRHHHAKELPDLPDGQTVWITSGATPVKGTVISSQSEQPRSYNVRADAGLLQRNRIHLNPLPNNPSYTEQSQDTSGLNLKGL